MSVDVESRLEALGGVWNDTVRHVTIDEVIGVSRPATVVEVLPPSKARRTPVPRARALVVGPPNAVASTNNTTSGRY